MSSQLPVIKNLLQEALASAGIDATHVDVDPLDEAGRSFIVSIVSDAFEGQTYLDREMRVRPIVARTFAQCGLSRAVYVIEVQTRTESALDSTGMVAIDDDELISEQTLDRINRQRWMHQVESVRRALQRSGYRLEDLEERLFIANREGLADEKILIGYARSPNARTVDLDTRKHMQTAQSSQRFAGHYYLAPQQLSKPFANQTPARWISVSTPAGFLHKLNFSTRLAERLKNSCTEALHPPTAEHRGQIIEPILRICSEGTEYSPSFSSFVKNWKSKEGCNLLVLMAPAGHGKTTLLQDLTRTLAVEFLSDPDTAPVPLLVPFESVRRTVDFDSLMHKRIAELCAGSYAAFVELLKSGRAILLVDGFDELADDAGASVAEAQVRSMRPLLEGEAKVILAGRSVFTQIFAGEQSVSERVRGLVGAVGVAEAEILPFNIDKVEEYVQSRDGLSWEERLRLLDYVNASPDHAELAANPLFLRILTNLASSNSLPSPGSPIELIDNLLERVCEREEERQHLGIGVAQQLEFLRWVATEIFRSSGTSISRSDVELIARETLGAVSAPGDNIPEIVGRLSGHALLAARNERETALIHPLIRDVLLAQSVYNAGLERCSSGAVISLRDLPEGTVQHLALKIGEWEFLRGVERSPSQARRNLFRIALRYALTQLPDGNPRDWLRLHWGSDSRMCGVDFGALFIESTSFDGVTFSQCDFSQTSFSDCDFRGVVFDGCRLLSTLFLACRASDVTAPGSSLSGVCVIPEGWDSGTPREIASPADLLAALVGGASAPQVEEGAAGRGRLGADPGDVRRCRDLVTSLLRLLAQVDPVEFHTIQESQLYIRVDDGRDRVAVDRVIVPLLKNKILAHSLSAGSRPMISIEKHWRPAVIALLREGRLSRNLGNFLHLAAAKAARFWR